MPGVDPDGLWAALEAWGDGFAVYRVELDPDGTVTVVVLELINSAGAGLLGAVPADLVGRDLREIRPNALTEGLWTLIAGASGSGRAQSQRVALGADAQGGVREVSATPVGTARVVVTFRDVTDALAGDRRLAAAYEDAASVRATLQTALDATSDAFAVYDVTRDGEYRVEGLRLVLINAAGAAPTGTPPDELAGQDLREISPRAVESGLWQAVERALESQVSVTFRLHERDSGGQWAGAWDHTVAPVGEDQVVVTWRDVSGDELRQRELARSHDQARYAATHDPLTGLANRSLLAEQLAEALWAADENDGVALVYLDLDGFKRINDTFGHAAGDDLLRAVATRLAGVVRAGDVTARVGGDEFVLMLRHMPADWDQDGFLRRLRAAVERPVLLADAVAVPATSSGVVRCPPAPRDLDRLLQLADARMYQDKLARRTRDGADPAGAEWPAGAAPDQG